MFEMLMTGGGGKYKLTSKGQTFEKRQSVKLPT